MRLAQLRTIRLNTEKFGGTGANTALFELKEADLAHVESERAR